MAHKLWSGGGLIWKKIKNLTRLRLAKFLIFFQINPPPDHNLGQILNSDPASSYFPLKFADLLKLKYFLHPWQPVILYYTITTIKANRDNSSYRINSLDLFCSIVLLLSCLSCYCYHYCPHKSAFQLKIAAQFSPPLPQF